MVITPKQRIETKVSKGNTNLHLKFSCLINNQTQGFQLARLKCRILHSLDLQISFCMYIIRRVIFAVCIDPCPIYDGINKFLNIISASNNDQNLVMMNDMVSSFQKCNL